MQTYLSTKCYNFYLEENIKIVLKDEFIAWLNERNIEPNHQVHTTQKGPCFVFEASIDLKNENNVIEYKLTWL